MYTCIMFVHHAKYVYMYAESDENTDFHVKHIVQTKSSIKHMSNIYGDAMQNLIWMKRCTK